MRRVNVNKDRRRQISEFKNLKINVCDIQKADEKALAKFECSLFVHLLSCVSFSARMSIIAVCHCGR